MWCSCPRILSVTSLAISVSLRGENTFIQCHRNPLLIEAPTGTLYAIEIGSSGKLAWTPITSLGAQWSFVGAGDYLGEGHDQFLVENTAGAVLLGDFTGGSVHYTLVGDFASQWSFHN